MRRIIAHLDMDAFFAAVEEREKPYLKGLPVVVGADPQGGEGRGVVSTANYVARKYGIGSAMPIRVAWRLSEEARKRGEPACAFIVPSGRKYGRASREVFALVREFSSRIQQTSVDEAYMDFSHYGTFRRAAHAARQLKQTLKKKTKLTCSIGIAPNKLVAKIASDIDKPDGLTVVLPQDVEAFLDPLSLRAIPGIGPKASEKLKRRGLIYVRDAKRLSWQEMESLFGKWGFGMYERLRGIDERGLDEDAARKSIGHHHTFSEDIRMMKETLEEMAWQAKDIVKQMHEKGFKGFRTVVLTVRFSDFTTRSRSLTVKHVVTSAKELEAKALKLALPFFEKTENPQGKAIRLIGLRVEKLY